MSQPQNINDAIETRRRSRSKTPLVSLRVSTDGENGSPGRKTRKTPTVGMIVEGDEEVFVQNMQVANQTRSTPVRKTRIVTSDYSSDDISPERARMAAAAVIANAANANVQLAKMAGQLSLTTAASTTSMTTTSSEATKFSLAGDKQAEIQIITSKTSNTSTTSSPGEKESLTGKLAASTSPKKDTGSPQKHLPSSGGTQQDGVVLTSSKRTTTTSTSKSFANEGNVGVIRTSTPKNSAVSNAPSTRMILTPEELQKHAAYKEYLEAGEYWNKYPKTDYTYSELSSHRREVAPGLIAMPNMSRPSLNKHSERVQTMIQQNPMQESFIRERYTSARTTGLYTNADPYDSTEEVDSYIAARSHRHQQQRVMIEQRSILNRFFLSIVTFCFTCVDSVRGVFRRRNEQHLYYTRIEDERGFFVRVYGFVSSFLTNVFKRIYLFISSVLFLDAWLLQTAAGNAEQQHAGQRKRRFLLFLLVLLPFLLIGGTLLYLDPSSLETVRASLPSGLHDLELKLPSLPAMPEMPNVPTLPDVDTVKEYVGDTWTDLSKLSGYYYDQLKLVTSNSAGAIRKLWGGGVEDDSTYLLADAEETIVLPASSRATLALSSLSHILPSNIRDVEVNLESFYRYMSNAKLDWRSNVPSITSVWSMVPSVGWLAALSWPWSWSWWSRSGVISESSAAYESIRTSLQRTLSNEEFSELMRHIDAYIDGVMEQKYAARMAEVGQGSNGMQSGVIAPEITIHVAQIIEESLKSYNYHLANADVDKVAEKVRLNLQANFAQLFKQQPKKDDGQPASDDLLPLVLTQENLAEIQRLVEQQITVQNNHFVIAGPQLEELLTRILSSDRLLALIDERVASNGARMVMEFQASASVTERQRRDALVDDLRKELNDIKMHFSEQLLSSSVQWEDRIQMVKEDHGQLSDQLRAYRLEHNELYKKLLGDIEGRLDAFRKERYEGVNKVVREHIITILGLNVKQDIADGDLRSWISGLFVARDHLEQRLEEIQAKATAGLREEIDRTAARLMEDVGEKIRNEMLVRLEEIRATVASSLPSGAATSESNGFIKDGIVNTKSILNEDEVKRIVRDALMIYDADKTGLVDYALESAGGQVLSTRCTESYQANSAEFRIFGIPIWYPSNTPRTVISPTMEPGQCWAFQGFPGYLVIQLNTEIIVTGFTLEHLSKLLVSNGSISSAPKHFTVWGLMALNDPEPVLLGSYEYLDKMGSSVQYFPVQNMEWEQPLQIVELRIESNHGNVHYTCLYRFRVHGDKG